MRTADGPIIRHSIGLSPWQRVIQWPSVSGATAVGLAIVVGCVVAAPSGLVYLALGAACIGSVLLAMQPRLALNVLLVALPFAAVPGILLQQTGWPTLLKDAFIVLPLYVGILASGALAAFRHIPKPLPQLLLALIALVLVMSIQPLLTTPLVALVGLKTWLWYVPMIIVPFVCVRDWADCWRIMRLMVLIAPIPGILAIVEAVLIYGGHQSTVYAWYGSLASDVTQNFATVNVSSSLLVQRIPSTFDFPSQFFGFSLAMLPLCICAAIVAPVRRWQVIGAIAALIVAIGGVFSGARSFLTLLPLDLILILLLVNQWRAQLVALSALSLLALVILGTSLDLGGIASFMTNLASFYLVDTTVREFGNVWAATAGLGMGIGTQTGASRYVLGANSTVGIGIEGWYAKVLFEVGAIGLIVVLAVWSALIGTMWAVRRSVEPTAQTIVSLVLVLIISTMVNLIKGPYIDLDPLNVYFWFMAGLALRLGTLNRKPILGVHR